MAVPCGQSPLPVPIGCSSQRPWTGSTAFSQQSSLDERAVKVLGSRLALDRDQFLAAVLVEVEGVEDLRDAGDLVAFPARVLVPPCAADHVGQPVAVDVDPEDVGCGIRLLLIDEFVAVILEAAAAPVAA